MGKVESLWRRMKRIWHDPEVLEERKAPPDAKAEFGLFYNSRAIGTLSLSGGLWTFRYSDEFRRDGGLRTITEFPDVDKTYVSSELWPFFLMRIPSLRQTAIKAIVAKEQIDERDEATLLKRFGRRTVANPFELVPSDLVAS